MTTNAKNLVSDEMVYKAYRVYENSNIGEYGFSGTPSMRPMRKAIEAIAPMLAQAGDAVSEPVACKCGVLCQDNGDVCRYTTPPHDDGKVARDAERYRWVPHLSHDEHGCAVCEWWNGSRKLTIYFRDEPPTYVKVWGPHITNEMEDGDILDNECMKALFIWLAAAPDGESGKP